ncbi:MULTISPECIES: response regulator [Aliarcobacter]|uniref:response regulator n=1 Tax=Aliarcobacter TaxID=2321111 RepID=UPI00083072A3|nr:MULTISPECIES: response regulator [Aliarcobacter]MDX3960470.1 response regulator [Aliarcobacter skirrowii]
MKLIYKILWIEDQMHSIRGKKRVISNYIENEKGFELEIKYIETFQQFKDEIGFDSLKNYDLLLIDLNLDDDESADGNKIIESIRNNNIYTEIIFYSSHYENLLTLLKENVPEGIFTSERKQIDTKAKKIIDVTLHKIQDVNNLRGLIMAEVAELDRIKKNIIQKFNKEADSDFKKYIKEDVFSKIKDDLTSLKCLVKVVESEFSHDEINLEELQNNFFYDSFKKSRTVNKIKSKKCNEIDFKHEDYRKDVIAKRNVLAHQKEEEDSDGKFLLYPNGNRLEFTEEHCIQIRKDIKKYKNLLEQISNKLDE